MNCSLEFDVHIADHVICQIITDVKMLNLSKFVHLLKDVLIEVLHTDHRALRSLIIHTNSQDCKPQVYPQAVATSRLFRLSYSAPVYCSA